MVWDDNTVPLGTVPIDLDNVNYDLIAKTTTADATVANRVDLATIDNTLLYFELDPASDGVCSVTQYGRVTAIDAGVCKIWAKADATDDWAAAASQSREWTFAWPDTDGDGVLDKTDNCRHVSNASQADTDGNGIGDACNDARDPDGDDYEYGYDNCPSEYNPDQADTDGNGIGDACNDFMDKDDDEWENVEDNCPNNPNPDQLDSNNNGIGDECDIDVDEDGVLDGVDNCPGPGPVEKTYNPDQEDANNDGIGDVCAADGDGDGVDDQLDNCPAQSNPNQLDSNNNGLGDVCEPDSDGDGVKDDNGAEIDNCPLIHNPDQADADGNGIGDACEMAFVKPVSSGTGDCLSWTNACDDLDTAISTATATGRSQIFMAEGVYRLNSTLNLTAGLHLIGGFAGVDSETRATQARPAERITVISGDHMADDTAAGDVVETVADKSGNNNLDRLLTASGLGVAEEDTVVLSGLVLNAAGDSTPVNGSALLVDGSAVELRSTRVIANEAATGVLRAQNGAQLTLRGSTVEANKATNGGAISAVGAGTRLTLVLSTLEGNQATEIGGAIHAANGAEVVIENGTLRGNTAASGGAMVTQQNNVSVDAKASLFEQNRASGNGGAVLVERAGNISFDQVEFNENAADQGGALYASSLADSTANVSITRSLFAANRAAGKGGAIASQYGAGISIQNTTLAFNKAGVDAEGVALGSTTAGGGAVYTGSGSVPLAISYSTLVANEAHSVAYGGGAIASNLDATTQVSLHGNLIAGNYANNGSNILVASGAGSASGKIVDNGYNLIGFNNLSGVEPAAAVSLATGSFVASEATLEEIVEVTLRRNGGDGYISKLRMLPIVGGGPARDAIPDGSCVVDQDARGEVRPDKKSGNACDIGAYEYTVLSCAEDAQRRYQQGETFVKGCTKELQNYELNLGYINTLWLLLLGVLGIARARSKLVTA